MIFEDRRKLSPRYIPDKLPHREGQIDELLMFFPDVESDVTTVVQLPARGRPASWRGKGLGTRTSI